jgi:two-component SAPR family response regulator
MNMLAEWSPDLAIVDVVLPKINGIDLAILLNSTVSVLPTVTVFRSAVHRRSPGGSHEKKDISSMFSQSHHIQL